MTELPKPPKRGPKPRTRIPRKSEREPIRAGRKRAKCGEPTVRVVEARLVDLGRRRTLDCYTCGESWRTLEIGAGVAAELLAPISDVPSRIWREVKP